MSCHCKICILLKVSVVLFSEIFLNNEKLCSSHVTQVSYLSILLFTGFLPTFRYSIVVSNLLGNNEYFFVRILTNYLL